MKGTAVLPTGCVPAIISLNLTSGARSGFIPSFVSENWVSADEQNAISVRDLNIDFVCVSLSVSELISSLKYRIRYSRP